MNTEDDTFRVLRQTPKEVIIPLYDQWWDNLTGVWMKGLADEFLKPHGWTYEDLYFVIQGKRLDSYDPAF